MIKTKIFCCLLFIVAFSFWCQSADCAAITYPIRSDAIVTHWPENHSTPEDKQPGWMRRQLMKFGEVASRVGNAMGTHATKITSAIDKVCEIVKTVIPLLAAVCHVGQFKFCAATTQAPDQLSEALNPVSLNLDVPDRRK